MSDNTRLEFKLPAQLTELSAEESAAFDIVKILHNAGHETYWAGGAVRDMILGLPVHDIDIATAARPEEIKKLFPDSYDRGEAFGVVAVRPVRSSKKEIDHTKTEGVKNSNGVKSDDREFEIATFRTDTGIADHRRPVSIKFVSAEEDAKRRDFTINGLFYDPIKSEIIDFIDGLRDIKRKIIRFIGEPQERINEDYLRMLRAARFAVRLDFKIEISSFQAIAKNADKINDISVERIREEFSKMLLLTNRNEAIPLLDKLGLLKEILPELLTQKNVPQPKEFHSEGDCWTHTLLALKNLGEVSGGEAEELVWTVLLHDIAKPQTIGYRSEKNKTSITFFDHDVQSAEMAGEILGRLRFSNHFIAKVQWAIRQHMRIIHAFRGMSERKQKKLFSDPNIQLLLDLTKADLSASLRPGGKVDIQMYEDALKLREKFEKETSEEEKHQVKKFDLVTGSDIMKILKLESSPEVGRIKTEIEQAYLDGKINTRDDALKMLEKYK